MSCWVVTPIKAPEDCKTRLQPALSAPARRELVAGMLRHVVETAQGAGGVDRVLVMGPSGHGLPADTPRLEDPGGGLNAVLAAALRSALDGGADRLVLLAADLPRLTREDVEALAGLGHDSLGLAPDRSGTGTNALSLPLPAAADFAFGYGPGSFARHAAEAARLGLALQVILTDTLALDIDEPSDLAAFDAP